MAPIHDKVGWAETLIKGIKLNLVHRPKEDVEIKDNLELLEKLIRREPAALLTNPTLALQFGWAETLIRGIKLNLVRRQDIEIKDYLEPLEKLIRPELEIVEDSHDIELVEVNTPQSEPETVEHSHDIDLLQQVTVPQGESEIVVAPNDDWGTCPQCGVPGGKSLRIKFYIFRIDSL
jgi:hypothetical protein